MSVPAGWYDDGSGQQRWWDGAQWTEHVAPAAADADTAVTDAVAEAPAAADDLDATVRREDITTILPEAGVAGTSAVAGVADVADVAPIVEPAVEAPSAPAAPEYSAPAANDYSGPAASDYSAPVAAAGGEYAPPAAAEYTAPAAPVYGDPNATAAYPTAAYPDAGAPAYAAPGQPYGAAAHPVGGAPEPKKTPILGFVGLGLAVLGTILACIPMTFIVGAIVLFAAFVVSIIAIFQKNTAKWPSIVGIILSIVGGIIGGTVFAITAFFTVANNVIDEFPTSFPTSQTDDPFADEPSDEPSDEPTDGFNETGDRPSAEEVEQGLREIIAISSTEELSDEQMACYGQYFVDSDISDDVLWTIASGSDATTDLNAMTEFADKLTSGISTCLAP